MNRLRNIHTLRRKVQNALLAITAVAAAARCENRGDVRTVSIISHVHLIKLGRIGAVPRAGHEDLALAGVGWVLRVGAAGGGGLQEAGEEAREERLEMWAAGADDGDVRFDGGPEQDFGCVPCGDEG